MSRFFPDVGREAQSSYVICPRVYSSRVVWWDLNTGLSDAIFIKCYLY